MRIITNFNLYLLFCKKNIMKIRIINKIKSKMKLYLDENQMVILDETLKNIFEDYDIIKNEEEFTLKES